MVAGTHRGRRLAVPAGTTTRPTADRVKEALFNALHSLDVLYEARVLDLFAGSGSLGIEALSRGAAFVDFVESDRAAAATVRSNLDTLGLVDATVHRCRVDAWTGPAEPADLVLADPPYSFDAWAGLFELVAGWAPDGVVVVESGAPVEVPPGWDTMREKAYGGTVVTFARVVSPRSPGASEC